MFYKQFQECKLSALGFGCMRLPTNPDGTIDEVCLDKMVDLAISNGINYFDTAFPYHEGTSEIKVGKSLSRYPRNSFYLASKYPGHQVSSNYTPHETFEKQLSKCQADYFDFYLLHNVCEGSFKVYDDPKYDIVNYFVKEKQAGRIKHLGFSSHGDLPLLKTFLDKYGKYMEFCQIQLNYLDYSLQNAKAKIELISSYNIPIWVMEPVRGGKLAKLTVENEAKLKAIRPNDSISSWAFRYLETIPEVTMILSGMSNIEQMQDNINTFKKPDPVSEDEKKLLYEIAESFKQGVPCTTCKYCMEGCPKGLNIPKFMSIYNELIIYRSSNTAMYIEFMDDSKKPHNCIKCGACARICPQKIDIPGTLSKLVQIYDDMPTWTSISKKREEEAKKL